MNLWTYAMLEKLKVKVLRIPHWPTTTTLNNINLISHSLVSFLLVAFILKHIITCHRQPAASVGRHATKICWSVMRRAQISSCALSYCVALLLLFSNLLVRNYLRWSVVVLKQTPWYNNIVFSLDVDFLPY